MAGKTVFCTMDNALLAATDSSLPLEERKVECVQRYKDLGLGRGIDATREKPWLQKGSFQVCNVNYDFLIGTEEGGMVEAYQNEVNSIQNIQLGMKASVTVPTQTGPVKVGVDCEHSRSVSNSRRVIGRRVINRSIAFREDCYSHLPFLQLKATKDSTDIAITRDEWSFEDMLSKWILDEIHAVKHKLVPTETLEKILEGVPPSHVFHQWYKENMEIEEINHQILKEICYKFVAYFQITHYVSSITLGALEYTVFTEHEFFKTVSQSTSAGFNMASLSGSASVSWGKTSKSYEVKKVGTIQKSDNKAIDGGYFVPRGTYAEAVVAAEFKSATHLIHNPRLKRALTDAIADYIDKRGDMSVGPFLIAAESRKDCPLYLTVEHADMTLHATTNRRLGNQFYIIMTDKQVYDFHIIYLSTSSRMTSRQTLNHIFGSERTTKYTQTYYVTTPLTVRGQSEGLIQLELSPKLTDTMFHLHSRLKTNNPPPESLGPWVSGREGFYLNCYGRKFAKDGYLAVKRTINEEGDVEYIPVCVPTRNAPVDTYKMIFRLIPINEEKDLPITPKPRDLRTLSSSPSSSPSAEVQKSANN